MPITNQVPDASNEVMIDALTAVLLERPEASLGELAASIGVGRTTLHRRFPTRHDVLRAIALRALDRLTDAYAGAELDTAFRVAPRTDEADTIASGLTALRSVIDHLIPSGPSLTFLLRSGDLAKDGDLEQRIQEMDTPMLAALDRGQHLGVLSSATGSIWLLETLYALVYIAWEQIERGALAPLDATERVLATWLHGVAGPAQR